MDEGETFSHEDDEAHYVCRVVEKTPKITNLLFEETPVTRGYVEANQLSENEVEVSATRAGYFWGRAELQLEDTPWRVSEVNEGQYVPTIIFERDEERDAEITPDDLPEASGQ